MDLSSPEQNEQYQRALAHFKRTEWQAALDELMALHNAGYTPPEVRELLADVQLKLRLTAPTHFKEPPRERRLPRRALLFTGAALLIGAVSLGALLTMPPAPLAVSAALPPTATAVPPTALPPTATVVPPTATTVVPTHTLIPATATALPPTATAVIAADAEPGTLQILLAPGQEQIIRTPKNIAIILDASGSMRGIIDGQPKILIAQQALSNTLAILPSDAQLALRTFGSTRGGDCGDLSLLAGLGNHDRAVLLRDLNAIVPVAEGRTPLTASLEASASDLSAAIGSTALIVVSDGEENCGGDPVAAARILAQQYPNVRIHVIGLAIGDVNATARLRSIAEVGGGSYFDASDANALQEALQQAVQLSYQVFNGEGALIAAGSVGGTALRVPAGRYRVRLNTDQVVEAEVEVQNGQATQLVLRGTGTTQTLAPAV